jgi:hypothetical protein
MRVLNTHERALPRQSRESVGRMLSTLGQADDLLWPSGPWPAMVIDGPVAPGAKGGHGPIRYAVSSYTPGERVVFSLTAPPGFEGSHRFELGRDAAAPVLRHVLDMRTRGLATLLWLLVIRPLHDALLEDLLAHAASAPPPRWSWYVRRLRSALRGRRRPAR